MCLQAHSTPLCHTALQLLEGGVAKRDGRLQVGDVVKKVGHPVCLSVCLCGAAPVHAGM